MTADDARSGGLAGEELQRRYRERLPERISILEEALEGLEDDPGAEARIREMAHLLRGSGTSFGHPGVTRRAARTEHAPTATLRGECEELIAELRRVVTAPDGVGGPVVLVVEDDPEMRYLLEVVLGGDGREVVAVERGEAARTVLDARPVDLVVLDLVLPDIDGRSLLRRIRERAPTAHVPVVVVSASATAAVQTECFRLGADAFFVKPFDPRTLQAAVHGHVARVSRRDVAARRDPLTGLLNAAGLREAWMGGGNGTPRTLALVELDGFDAVEVRQGWSAAEAALGRVAAALEEAVTGTARIARWEGECFVVLFDEGPDAVRPRVDAMLEAVRNVRVPGSDGETFRLTASAGIGIGSRVDDLGDVMDAARSGIYRARAAGGNRLGDGEAEGGLPRRRVLVAEDDDITASLLRHRLERDGFEVDWHPNGASAFEAALRSHPDLVILDVRMPGMDGFELLERLRRVGALRKVPVVLLTSMGSEDDLVRGFALGADDYVLKPFSPTEFLARIRRLLSRP